MTEGRAGIRALVLAAGYGSRLAPLTDHRPKPLLPLGERTLLDHAIAALRRASLRHIAVNAHHLAHQVQTHLASRPDAGGITLFHEKEILGTGGALHNAAAFLGQGEHFVIHNGDVHSNADLAALVDSHCRSGALATLLLTDHPPVNSVAVDGAGAVHRIGGDPAADDPAWRRLTYTGIGVFRRELLEDIGPGFSSLIDPLVRAKDAQPGSVRGCTQAGLAWSDMGTPATYLAALPEGAPSAAGGMTVRAITGHGSDRRFWRLACHDFSCVAMVSPAEDQEYLRFVAVAEWLHAEGLGGPAILAARPQENSVLMEDLGEESLLRHTVGADQGRQAAAYRLVLDHLIRLQAATSRARQGCLPAVDRTLDLSVLRWETDYFRQRFLEGHAGLAAAETVGLEEEFAELARVTAAQPLVLIHRDFQAQNIHLQDGQVRLVDVQGMRLGPLGYDAMSLIMDPYTALSDALRRDLLDEYCTRAARERGTGPSAIRAMCLAAGSQRIMQALGAYGFLGHVKGKNAFLAHIPEGLRALDWILGQMEQCLAGPDREPLVWLPRGGMPRLRAHLDEVLERREY